MSRSLLVRLAGLAAMAGGVLWAAKVFYDRNDAPPWPTDITDTLFFIVPLLFLAGLAGLYAQSRGRLSRGGKIALAVSFAGFAISVIGGLIFLLSGIGWFVYPTLFLGLLLAFLGLAVLGGIALQTRALPRWNALPLVIGLLGIVLFVTGDPPNSSLGVYPSLALWMLFGLGWVALGYVLWSSGEEEIIQQPARVR